MAQTATAEKPVVANDGYREYPVLKRLGYTSMMSLPGYIVSSRYAKDHEGIWQDLLNLLTDHLRLGNYDAYESILQSFKIGLERYAYRDYEGKGPIYRKMSETFRMAADDAGVHVLSRKGTFDKDRRTLIVKRDEGPLVQATGARPGTNAGPDGNPDFADIPTMVERVKNEEYSADIDATEILGAFAACAHSIDQQDHEPDWVQSVVALHLSAAHLGDSLTVPNGQS